MRKVKRWRRSQRDRIISGYAESGMSVAEYCRKDGIPKSTFYTWRRKHTPAEKSPKQGFIKIKPARTNPADIMKVVTPEGYCIEIPSGADSLWIERVVRALIVR